MGNTKNSMKNIHKSRDAVEITTHYHCEKRMIKLIVTGRHSWWQGAMMKINGLQYTLRTGNNGTWQKANKWTWPSALINELLSSVSTFSGEQHKNLNEKSIALCNSKVGSIVWLDFSPLLRGCPSPRQSSAVKSISLKKSPIEDTWHQPAAIYICHGRGFLSFLS